MKRVEFTLAELQQRLDELAEGAVLQLGCRDYERRFGLNDVALGRLRNFSKIRFACWSSILTRPSRLSTV